MNDRLRAGPYKTQQHLFNRVFYTSLGTLIGLVFLVNIAVDPWQVVRDEPADAWYPRIQNKYERVSLPYIIERSEFSVLIVGSSRARYLLDRGLAPRASPILS